MSHSLRIFDHYNSTDIRKNCLSCFTVTLFSGLEGIMQPELPNEKSNSVKLLKMKARLEIKRITIIMHILIQMQ